MALPPSSPRLPSPPPPAEIQIGPKSPASSGGSLAQQQMEQQMEQTILDANAKRRIHPGTRTADFAVGPPLVPLNELDSAFQLQEHLAALHYFHTTNNTQPISRETARILAQAPPGTDRTLWLYELCRFLIAQCNSLIIGFLFDTPPCSAATCPEMRASEWQFLCAVHEQPKSCCAIDYCCHTLDWAANVVTNPKIFPSRFVFADAHDKNAAVKNLINVFRRLHRIFAHAWFQHRGVFWSVEGQTGLYVFFKTVCDMYDLLPAENYKLPPEAEGLDMASTTASGPAAAGSGSSAAAVSNGSAPAENVPGVISVASLGDRKALGYSASPGPFPSTSSSSSSSSAGVSNRPSGPGGGNSFGADLLGGDGEHIHSVGRTNTRRHIRSSPSTGSAVTTVLEQDEDGLAGSHSSSSLPSDRPVSAILPSSQGTTVLAAQGQQQTAAALTPAAHAAAAPSVVEHEVPADHEAHGSGDGLDEADVPVIVQHDQQDWTPIAAAGGETGVSAVAKEERHDTAQTTDAPKAEQQEAPTESTARLDESGPAPSLTSADVSTANEKENDASAGPASASEEKDEGSGRAEAAAASTAKEESASAATKTGEDTATTSHTSVQEPVEKDTASVPAAAVSTEEAEKSAEVPDSAETAGEKKSTEPSGSRDALEQKEEESKIKTDAPTEA